MNRWIKLRRTFVDAFLGPVWRQVPRSGESPTIYLTFDDGPEPGCTDRVLDILDAHNVQATFFVIVEKAEAHRELVMRALAEGHGIGNHSLDHSFVRFIGTRQSVLEWLDESERRLRDIIRRPSLAWRAPAGIRTPEVRAAVRRLGFALVHWDVRFYDTMRPFTRRRAEAMFRLLQDGSIVLLHDCHKGDWSTNYLQTLDWFLAEAKRRGYGFAALPGLGCAEESLAEQDDYASAP